MSDYYVDLDGNISKKKKKKKSDYSVSADGKITRTPVEEDDDIAPVKDERKWFQKGAFEDGWQKGDLIKTIFGSKDDAEENLWAGILGIGEKLIDAGATLGTKMNEASMMQAAQSEMMYNAISGNKTDASTVLSRYQKAQDEAEKGMAEWVAKDLYDEEKVAHTIVSGKNYGYRQAFGYDVETDSVFGEKSDALVQSGGQLLAQMGVNTLVPGSGMALMAATAFGSEAESAFNQGATFDEAILSSTISAGAEVLTEKLGGISFGGKTWTDAMFEPLARKMTSKLAKGLIYTGKIAADATAEGFEEIVSGYASAIGQKMTYMEDKEIEELFSKEDRMESFIGGFILGGFGGVTEVAQANRKGVNPVSGLTKNEEKVVNKVYEDKLAEREKNGKLSAKEKTELFNKVVEQMERGYIETDTIESVLGGENYKTYKETIDSENSLVEQEKALTDEYNALNKKMWRDMTGEEMDRREELKTLLPELRAKIAENKKSGNSNQLKSKLFQDVSKLVQNDRLAESYREQERAKQDFKADFDKYKGTKHEEAAKKTIENAIKSGANNTNAVHDLVDLATHISAESGKVVEFKTDEDIVEDFIARQTKVIKQFEGIENRTAEQNKHLAELKEQLEKVKSGELFVDGNITGDTIVLNIGSKDPNKKTTGKPLNRIIGHEVTHSVEKAKSYDKLRDHLFAYAKSKGVDIDAEIAKRKLKYEGIEDANPEAELVADLVGDYLFTDKDFVNNLSTSNRNLAQKIYDEIKHLLKMATAGSKEARELERVKYAFENAFREAEQAREDAKISAEAEEFSDANTQYSIREKAPPKNTIEGYKVFIVKDGKLYPPMVANPEGEGTPVGVWLDADVGGLSYDADGNVQLNDRGRFKVKAGGKGTQGGGGELAFRPGWHLGEYPDASQFGRDNAEHLVENRNGKLVPARELFPYDFVWARCEVAADNDYQLDAMSFGVNEKGNFERTQAGLPYVPEDGYYKYRTNPDPNTAPWIISGSIKVVEILDDEQVAKICAEHGVTPQQRQAYSSETKEDYPTASVMKEELAKAGVEFKKSAKAAELKALYSQTFLNGETPTKSVYSPEARPGNKIDLSMFGLNSGQVTPTSEDVLNQIRQTETTATTRKAETAELLKTLPGYAKRQINFDDANIIKEFGLNNQSVDEYRAKAEESGHGYLTDEKIYGGEVAPAKYSLSDSNGNELSPGVQKWSAKSKAVDYDGNLKVLYHGTPNGEFTIFDKSKGSVEGDFGSGFYFTDNEDDVSRNYEGGGPDFENKIDRRAEQIEDEEGISYGEARKRAIKELYVGSNKFEVYLNIENPAIVGETTLLDYESFAEEYDREDYDSEEDWESDVEYLISDKIDEIIWDVQKNVDVYSTEGLSEVLWNAVNEGGIDVEQLKKNINELYLEDSEGHLVGNEVTRQIIESLGYDGIIDPTVSSKFNMGLSEDTTHYIVFKPNQIKNVSNQNPTDNPDINLSMSERGEDIAPIGNYDFYGKDFRKKIFNSLTGKEISKKAYETLDRLGRGEAVTLDELNSLPEVVEGREKVKEYTAKFLAEHPEFKDVPTKDLGTHLVNSTEREQLRSRILKNRLESGSFTHIDKKGKEVYNGSVEKGKRLDIVIGLPAAGKSTSIVLPLSQYYKSVVVDSDIIKEELPEFEGGWGASLVHEESSAINAELFDRVMQTGSNIVLPIVGAKSSSIEKYLVLAKDQGYDVYLHLNELNSSKAMGRNLGRYFSQGRFIPPEIAWKYGDKPTAVYEEGKNRGDISGYSHWNNDVQRGQRPTLIDISGNLRVYGEYSNSWRASRGANPESGIGASSERTDANLRDGVGRPQGHVGVDAPTRENSEGSVGLPKIVRLNPKTQEALTKSGVVSLELIDSSNDSNAFSIALSDARNSDEKNGWAVTPKTAEELVENNIRTIMSSDGKAGLGVAPDGDIEAVFKNQNGGQNGVLKTLIPAALEMGGNKLDCYGEGLVNLYSRYGFVPVARVTFNPEYANEGWTPEKGTPDIFFMVHNGDSADIVASNIGKYKKWTTEELNALPLFGEDYDAAYAYRDSKLPQTGIAPVADNDIAPVAEAVNRQSVESVVGDRDSFVSKQAMELYEEISNLKKGVRASKRLGYLLDHGYEWRSIKTALLNIRDNPNQVVNPNSAAESVAREMIGREYDAKVEDFANASGVTEKIFSKMKDLRANIESLKEERDETIANWDYKIAETQKSLDNSVSPSQTELENLKASRQEAIDGYNRTIANKQAELDGKKNTDTKVAHNLKMQIERLTRLRDSTDAEYAKRISQAEQRMKSVSLASTKLKARLDKYKQLRNRADTRFADSISGLEARLEKMSKPEYKTAMQRRAKQNELNSLIENLVGDTSTWVDKKLGIAYKVNTLRRNLRDIVRDANGNQDIAKADAIYDELQGKYNHNEAELKRESMRIKEVFQKMKLNHAEDTYAHMLGEFRHNPDSKLTEEDVKEYYEKHKKNIDTKKVNKAIEESRKVFDELIVRVNERLREQGMKEIPYRQGYFPHFTNPKQGWLAKFFNWKPVDNEIPTSIAGLTEEFNPQRSWQSFNKQRKGDTTDYSLEQGLDTYIHGALDWIYHIEDIQKRRALENHIRYVHSEEGVKKRIDEIRNNESYDADEAQAQIDAVYAEANNPLNNFVTDLRAGTNTLANKKSSMDRKTEEMTNRKIYSVMTNLNNRINANMVVGSFSSALTNFIPITQSWMEVSPVYSLKGMRDTIKSTIRDDGIVNKSDFLTNRLMNEEKLYQTGWDKVSEKAAIMMEAIDSFTSQTVWRSKYLQNISEGMSETEAIKNADQFAENVIAGRSRGNQPTIFDAKNPLTKIFTAFQLEVANQYGYMFKDAPQDSKNKARLVKGYATAFLGAYAYNALYSSLVGRDAAFDPISILEDLFKDLFGDDEEEPEEILLNLTDNILEEVPFVGGLLGGGRIPMSSAIPYEGDYKTFITDLANKELSTKEMLKPLYYLAMPVGGGQLKKFNEGMKMFDDDLPVSGSYTESGNLRFPVEKTFGNVVQAGMFGQYASKNARDYFDNGRSPLKEKQIQEYLDVDIPIADYWEYREGLAKQKKTEDKLDYISDLDLPVYKKNILANNVTDRKDPIDMEGYEDFSSLDEFDFATKNPGKYAVSQVVGDYSTYTSYKDHINDLEADKDENGKSINGSKKEKVFSYIDSLPLDYGQKCILFKSQYKADDSMNKDILEYLDSREDISYDEMVTILTELDFTVNGNNVYWD